MFDEDTQMRAELEILTSSANKQIQTTAQELDNLTLKMEYLSKLRLSGMVDQKALSNLKNIREELSYTAKEWDKLRTKLASSGGMFVSKQDTQFMASLLKTTEDLKRSSKPLENYLTSKASSGVNPELGTNTLVSQKEQNKLIKELTGTYNKLQSEIIKSANAMQYYDSLGTESAKRKRQQLGEYYDFLNRNSRMVDPFRYMTSGDTSFNTYTRLRDSIQSITMSLSEYSRISKLSSTANLAETFKTASPYILQSTKELEKFTNLSTGLERTLNKSKFANDASKEGAKNFITGLNVEIEAMQSSLAKYDSAITKAEAHRSKVYQDARYSAKTQASADAEVIKLQKEKEDYITKQRIALSQYNQEAAKHRDLMSEQSGVKYWGALASRALAYYGIYQAITTLQSTAGASIGFLVEADTIARTFAALSDTKDQNKALQETQVLTRQLVDLNKQYGGTLKEIGQASLELKRAGTPEKDIVASTEAVIKLAALTGDTIAQSASALVTYTQVYGELAAQQGKVSYSTQEIGDKLAYMANQSRLSTQDIGTFSNYALATATQVGFTIDAINGMGIALTNAGFNASTAGTQVRKFASVLGDTSTATTKFFSTIGYNQKQLAADIAKGGAESDQAFMAFLSHIRSISPTDFTKSLEGMDLLQKNILQALRANAKQVTEAIIGSVNDAEGSINRANIITESYQKTAERLWATILDGIGSSLKPLADILQYTTQQFLDGSGAIKGYNAELDALKKYKEDEGNILVSMAKSYISWRAERENLVDAEKTKWELITSEAVHIADYSNTLFVGLKDYEKSFTSFIQSTEKEINSTSDYETKLNTVNTAIDNLTLSYNNMLTMYSRSPIVTKILTESLVSQFNALNKMKEGIEALSGKSTSGTKADYKIISDQSTKDLQKQMSFIESVLSNTKAKSTEIVDNWINDVNKKITIGREDLGKQISASSANLGLTEDKKKEVTDWFSTLFDGVDTTSVESLSKAQVNIENFLKAFEGNEGMATFSKDLKTLITAMIMFASESDKIKGIIKRNVENDTKTANQLAEARKKEIELTIERNKILLEGSYIMTGITSEQQSYVDSVKAHELAEIELTKQLEAKKILEETLRNLKGEDAKSTEARNKLLEVENNILKAQNDVKRTNIEQTVRLNALNKATIERQTRLSVEAIQQEINVRTALMDIEYAKATIYDPLMANSQKELISASMDYSKSLVSIKNAEDALLQSTRELESARSILAATDTENAEAYRSAQEAVVTANNKVILSEKSVELAKIQSANTAAILNEKQRVQTGSMYDGFSDASNKFINNMMTQYEKGQAIANALTDSMTNGFEDFFDVTSANFVKFDKLALSVLNDVYKAAMRAMVVQPLVGAIMGGIGGMFGGFTSGASTSSYDYGSMSLSSSYFTPNAKGGAYSSPSLSAYSSTIVDKPTPFMFAKGGALGVMGEAGAEAIMPLAKNSSGELGVKVANQGSQNITVEIKNESNQQMEVTSVQQTVDTEGLVLSIVVNGIQKNKMGLRDMLGR